MSGAIRFGQSWWRSRKTGRIKARFTTLIGCSVEPPTQSSSHRLDTTVICAFNPTTGRTLQLGASVFCGVALSLWLKHRAGGSTLQPINRGTASTLHLNRAGGSTLHYSHHHPGGGAGPVAGAGGADDIGFNKIDYAGSKAGKGRAGGRGLLCLHHRSGRTGGHAPAIKERA